VSLTRRLLLSYLAIIGLTTAVVILAGNRLLRSRLTADAAAELEREARYFEMSARGRDARGLDSLVHALTATTGRRLTVVDRSGAVLADSDFPQGQLGSLENHAARPEIREALAGRTGTDLRRSVSTGRDELKVAIPSSHGAVRISAPLPQVEEAISHSRGAVLLGAFIAALAAAVLALAFAVNVTRPLRRLRDAAEAIARGDRPALDVRGRHEVGQLARALRTVDDNLSGRLADLERERAGMAALIGSMVEGVVACDARGTVTAVNPAARELLGLGDGAAPPVQEIFRPRAAREAIDATLHAGTEVTDLEVEVDHRTVLLSGRALKDGGAVFVVHDLTTLKRLEAVRRDFVANVSHELKTPLTVIRGFAETLRKDEPPRDVAHGFLDTMLANTRRMQQLIDDLLDLSRIESRAWTPEPEPVELEPLAREVWAGLSQRGNAPTLTFETDITSGAALLADRDALRQILVNVLDNAARYTPAGGTVTVRARPEGDQLRLEVSDTGSGIPSDQLSRIFERFYRVDPARSRELGGTGLGLAIVKHLVEAQGGRVEALSVLGAGTTIRIVLPAA